MCDQLGALHGPEATSFTLAPNFGHTGLLTVPHTRQALATSEPLTLLGLPPGKFSPYRATWFSFSFSSPLHIMSLHEFKSSLKTVFQITPSCTNPISRACFRFFHSIPNYPPTYYMLSFYCLSLSCQNVNSRTAGILFCFLIHQLLNEWINWWM